MFILEFVSLHQVFSCLAFIALVSGLAPIRCAADVENFVVGAMSSRPYVKQSTISLSSCACMLDTSSGFTPLHFVALRGGANAGGVINVLVNSRANVLEVDRRSDTALHVAAVRAGIPAVAALLHAARQSKYLSNLLWAKNDVGMTALDKAEDVGRVSIALFLSQQGATRGTPRSIANECSWPVADAVLHSDLIALKVAANWSAMGTYSVIQADCFYPPSYRERPLLHIAISVCGLQAAPGGLPIVQSLLAHGANASQADGSGDLPLARAARLDRIDIVRLLLASMPQNYIDLQDAGGKTALHEAARIGARSSALALVLQGASLDIRDHAGLTPLDYAHQQGHSETALAMRMAARLPPAKLGVPGNMHNSNDEFPPEAGQGENEESSTTAIIGSVVGIGLGVVTGFLMAMVAVWRLHLHCSKTDVIALPEAVPGKCSSMLKIACLFSRSRRFFVCPQIFREEDSALGGFCNESDGMNIHQDDSSPIRQVFDRQPVVIQVPCQQHHGIREKHSQDDVSTPKSDSSELHLFTHSLSIPSEDLDLASLPHSPKGRSLGRSRVAGVLQADSVGSPAVRSQYSTSCGLHSLGHHSSMHQAAALKRSMPHRSGTSSSLRDVGTSGHENTQLPPSSSECASPFTVAPSPAMPAMPPSISEPAPQCLEGGAITRAIRPVVRSWRPSESVL